jgi:hypothetical protein
LIRSRDGQVPGRSLCRGAPPILAQHPQARALQSEVIHFPAPRPGKDREHSVSVLDLEQNRSRSTQSCVPQVTPTLGRTKRF